MQLTAYRPAPSGMSFNLDSGPAQTAGVLMPPGHTAIIGLTGEGVWTVDVLTSVDGLDYTVIATLATPGTWRYETSTVAAIAVRFSSYTSGRVTATLTQGGVLPFTFVSPLFNTFLIYSFNATPSEPPIGNQIRFDNTTFQAVTKVWLRFTTVPGDDVYQALRKIPFGGTLLVQKRDDHTAAVVFRVVGPVVVKTDYVEVPVSYRAHTTGGALPAAQVLVAVFSPGPTVSFARLAGGDFALVEDPRLLPESTDG